MLLSMGLLRVSIELRSECANCFLDHACFLFDLPGAGDHSLSSGGVAMESWSLFRVTWFVFVWALVARSGCCRLV